MILDILFTDKAPSQYQGVRMHTVYNYKNASAAPEVVIHFYDYSRSQLNIPLENIKSIQVTND